MARRKATPNKLTANKNQLYSVILFAVGLLLLALTFIEGKSIWTMLHNVLYGLFGISVFLVAPLTLYVAVLIAAKKDKKCVLSKCIQGAILLLLISGTIQIFVGKPDNLGGFFPTLEHFYTQGLELRGGGFFGAVFGWTMLAAFGQAGAAIIVILLAFVCFMLLSGISLLTLLKPFKKLGAFIRNRALLSRERRKIRRNERQNALALEENVNSKQDRFKDIAANIHERPSSDVDISKPETLPDNAVVNTALDNQNAGDAQYIRHLHQTNDLPTGNTDDELSTLVKRATAGSPRPQSSTTPARLVVDSDDQVSMEVGTQPAYKLPPISLLNQPKKSNAINVEDELKANADNLVNTLRSFGVETRVIDINRGPTVTRYELQPSAGVKISKITNLSDDIALNLATAGVRIEAPIPNKPAVGIEVPNKVRETVSLRSIIDSKTFDNAKSMLTVAVGKDIAGEAVVTDLSKMPHLLIAGTTGSGKSVCINSMIMSILYRSTPDDVRMIMIDPKQVELKIYNGIPHLLIPVVTDPRKAAGALGWAVTEMLNRYKLFADNNVRDISGFNAMAKGMDELEHMPHILIVIDELSDLMMAAPSEVEDAICRLAQMARAAGMHLVIGTQRPSVDVVTGLIKANIPSRIALTVKSQIDSRTIIDSAGAEKLLGNGDMLFFPVGVPKPVRIQGCYVSDKEVERVVDYITKQGKADYDDDVMSGIEQYTPAEKARNGVTAVSGGIDGGDEMLESAIELVVETGQATTSFLQRKLRLGFARAARIMDEMEEMGIVGTLEGNKRQVLMSKAQWYERISNS